MVPQSSVAPHDARHSWERCKNMFLRTSQESDKFFYFNAVRVYNTKIILDRVWAFFIRCLSPFCEHAFLSSKIQNIKKKFQDSFIIELLQFYDDPDNFKNSVTIPVLSRIAGSYRLKHCVPRTPLCEVSTGLYLFAYCLNPQNTMHFTKFRPCRNATHKLSLRNWVKRIVF